MDVFGALQDTLKKTNGTATRRSSTKEVSSRYRSPTPTSTSTSTSSPSSRRYSSPSITRNGSKSSSSASASSKRALSAERKRPSTPPSPPPASTPVADTTAEGQALSKKTIGSKLSEVLWPSTRRSLSVSFQSDSISIPVSKKEKPVSSHNVSDRTLKPSSNISVRDVGLRKPTPERKPSPLKGKSSSRLSENSRPVDSAQARLIDHHRWPSRNGGIMSVKSVDLSNNNNGDLILNFQHHNPSIGISSLRRLSSEGIPRNLHNNGDMIPNFLHNSSIRKSSLRRLSADGIPKFMQKSSSDSSSSQESEFEDHIGTLGLRVKSIDDSLLRVSSPSVRSRLVPGSRLTSPSRARVSKVTPSPSKTRPSTPTQSRGTSPSRIRQSSPTRLPSSTPSVLSFVADIKKGKKTNQLEDAHQLRLLYNRHLQWRFANARAESALFFQKIAAEQTLYNVWEANLDLWDSVLRKRIELQRLNLDLKISLVLREQMAYLEDWALLEEDHSFSLDGVIEDLEASTLRLPVTEGAKADVDSLKVAISSAADVMQMMGSSICSLLSKAEGMNGLVSELAELAGHERAMLNQCDTLLSSSAAMQVKEYSLRTQLIQAQQNLHKTRLPLFWETS